MRDLSPSNQIRVSVEVNINERFLESKCSNYSDEANRNSYAIILVFEIGNASSFFDFSDFFDFDGFKETLGYLVY